MIGKSGIVILESKFNFRIITEQDKILVIPKKCCVFEIEFFLQKSNKLLSASSEASQENESTSSELPKSDKYRCEIFGENFLLAPGMRITKKFKNCPPISIF